MQAPLLHNIQQQNFWLSALRAVYWEEQKALIVSDLHFGKTGHFRKSGIAVPQSVYKEDLQRLINLLTYFTPRQLLVVGDFFHSHANLELDLFKRWREDFSHLHIILIKGNHDILQTSWYASAAIEVLDELIVDGFYFNHAATSNLNHLYTFSGHIHPGIALNGLGKQSLRFPCFYFARQYCVLPAFSLFTGMVRIHPQRGETVVAIAENTLIRF